jgi:hypothetical protein
MSATCAINRLGDSSDSELAQGISGISLRIAPHGRPIAVTLWQTTMSGMRIESVMHDMAERIEVGVLSITHVDAPFADEVLIEAPDAFRYGVTLTKLFLMVENTYVESGLSLHGRDGCEIVIVTGAFPYSLAISGVGEWPHLFEPEYPITLYQLLKTE